MVAAHPGLDPPGELDLERGRLDAVHRVPPAQLLAGQRVQSGPEEELHLLAADLIPGRKADTGHAAAVPVARRLALDAVVIGERRVAAARGVHGRGLAGQVLVARPR